METANSKEEIIQKHRKEKKDLQAKIQALKKTATKGDKKKKRDVAEEIAKLETELDKRHEEELATFGTDCDNNLSEVLEDLNVSDSKESCEGGGGKVSKAQRRRDKKALEQKEREERILKQEADNINGARNLEIQAILKTLLPRGLEIYEIPSDGNCLYSAVDEELGRVRRAKFGVAGLRQITADCLRTKRDHYLPFLCDDLDRNLDNEEYEEYCNKVQSTTAWGGQVELMALAETLKCCIEVLQDSGPAVLMGNSTEKPDILTLTYHRHMYGLGEHYNSVKPIVLKDEEGDGFKVQT